MDQFITADVPSAITTTTAPQARQPGHSNGQAPAQPQPTRIQFRMNQVDIELMVLMDEAQAQVPGAFARTIRYLNERADTDLLKLPLAQLQQVMDAVNEELKRLANRGN